MPSLKDLLAVKSLPGFASENNPTNPPVQTTGGFGQNPYRRCPLPPFNAGPDTLRQFDESGKVPARRVIPLPVPSAGTGGSVTNVTQVTTAGSGGGSSSPTLASASVSISVPTLSPGQIYSTTVQMAKSFQLLQMTSTNAVEVRVYASALSQTVDVTRSTDTAPPFEVTAGLITDVVFDTAPFQWNWQNRIGANADGPQTKTIYITVVNYGSSGIGASIVSLTFLPLET